MTTISELPQFHVEDLDSLQDEALLKALEKSCQEQSTMPLLKQELKYTIQYRRMSSGQNELFVEEKQKPDYKLTEEEVRRRNRRREQNRMSSFRCRRKRKDYSEHLETVITDLEKTQSELHSEVESLRKTKRDLETLIKIHSNCDFCMTTNNKVSSFLKQCKNGMTIEKQGTPIPIKEQVKTSQCTPLISTAKEPSLVSLLKVH